MEGLWGDWLWSVWCEIPKKKIINNYVKETKRIFTFLFHHWISIPHPLSLIQEYSHRHLHLIDVYGNTSFWVNDGYIHCDKQLTVVSSGIIHVRILAAMILGFTQRGRFSREEIRVRFYRVLGERKLFEPCPII